MNVKLMLSGVLAARYRIAAVVDYAPIINHLQQKDLTRSPFGRNYLYSRHAA
jgi:hypothetical protein